MDDLERRNAYGVPLYHDGQIKRRAVPAATRRAVALRHGGIPGRGDVAASCAYCGAAGRIWWPELASGRPGSWVTFIDLQMDHIVPYSKGGSNSDPDNFTLACRRCNASKWNRDLTAWAGAA